MLRKLRIQLTLICISITGLILLIISLVSLQVSEYQLNQRNRIAFESQLHTIAYHLQYNQTISHSWLAQLEVDNNLILSIEDNGSPLLFRGAWTPTTPRDLLFKTAKSAGLKEYDFDIHSSATSSIKINSKFFKIKGVENEYYRSALAIVPSVRGTYAIIMLQSLEKEMHSILFTRILFLSISTFGIALLGLFSWWFSGRAILPLENNQRKQVDFIAAASHELKSPLAVIQSSIGLLRKDDGISSVTPLHMIDRECKRMARLVDDLLLLATADANTWSIRKSTCELDTLIIDMYDTFLPMAQEKYQALDIILEDDRLPPIQVDKDRLEQAIGILLDNAIFYVPEHGHIKVILSHSINHLIIQVVDNGPGIKAAYQNQVFDRFYRIDNARKDKNHYGLGLSIAREIIRLHQGTLTLKDTPGGGCTFTMVLPLV